MHLISAHRFPIIQQVSLEQAFRYLLDAPQIVKSLAPMSWSYAQAPQDGMLWLEWLSPDRYERFPSDGYVWGDQEQTYRQELGGYTIEMMVHTIGYRMQYDHMASHARTRYHFVAKNPSINAAPPDPSLWIVHYHQAEHARILPSSQVPFTPQMQQIMSERRWLESQGRLEKKDFMLHDRGSWPTIEVPRGASTHARQMQQPGFYGANAQQNRYPQYYPQQAGQPPQAKRQKMSAPVPGAAGDGVHDTSIEDEENTTLGDFFDHLTPRDISMARYMQHHRWMEEVFSSPYASAQIVPVDLGLGLMGGLKGLTEGILEPPSLDFTSDKPQAPKAKEAQAFTNLKKKQIDEFNSRVEKHLKEGQDEIERMKADHAAKMAEWKKTKTLMQAEKRLRYATWEGHESAMPAYRLEEPHMNGHAEEGAKEETVEDVVKEVEEALGVKISGHREASLIEKGGLEKEESPREQVMQDERRSMPRQAQQPTFTANGGVTEAQTYHSDPVPPVPENKPQHMPPSMPQPGLQQQDTQAAAATQQAQQQAVEISSMDMNDTSMMDEGFDDPNFDFGGDEQLGNEATEPAVSSGDPIVNAQNSGAIGTGHTTVAPAAFGIPAGQAPPAGQPQEQISTTEEGALTGEPAIGASAMAGDAGNNDIFDNSTFDDFTNMDDAGGDDGLIDFEGGGMGGDDMFGDAMHGMGDEGDGGDGGAAGGQ